MLRYIKHRDRFIWLTVLVAPVVWALWLGSISWQEDVVEESHSLLQLEAKNERLRDKSLSSQFGGMSTLM